MTETPHIANSHTRINRRRFLGLAGGAAASGLLVACNGNSLTSTPAPASTATPPNGATPTAPPAPSATPAPSSFGLPAERTLVVVEMSGGNDALNTLVPQDGRYYDARPSVALPEDELLTFGGLAHGVNPVLAPLAQLWDRGQLAGMYGVGLPEQSRSHFVASDAWWSAQPGQPATSGWLGRWLENTADAEDNPLRSVAFGGATLATQGMTGRAVSVQSVQGYQLTPPGGNDAVTAAWAAMADPRQGGVYGEAQAAIPATISSVDELQSIISTVSADTDTYGPDPALSLFGAAQAVIQADIGAQVLYVKIGGFDTHAGQRDAQDVLLGSVAQGVANLFSGLEASGHANRTMALVWTEFGRRVEENGSAGTDHGKGGLALVAGPAVDGGRIIGEPDLADLDAGDLRITHDSRSLYTVGLEFLGGVQGAFDGTFDTHDLLLT